MMSDVTFQILPAAVRLRRGIIRHYYTLFRCYIRVPVHERERERERETYSLRRCMIEHDGPNSGGCKNNRTGRNGVPTGCGNLNFTFAVWSVIFQSCILAPPCRLLYYCFAVRISGYFCTSFIYAYVLVT